MVQSTILKEISRIKILDFALSVKGDVAPILKSIIKEHQITTTLGTAATGKQLKSIIKEHQITTRICSYMDMLSRRDNPA